MISQCLNPACQRELHYLRNGRVVRIIHGSRPAQIEHFWLCGECSRSFDFCFSVNGVVTLKPKRPMPVEQPLAGSMVA